MKGLFRKQFDTPAEDEEEGEADGEGGTESTTTPLLAGHVTVLQRDHRQRGRKDDWEKTAAQPVRTVPVYLFQYIALFCIVFPG